MALAAVAQPAPQFDVASIKPSKPDAGPRDMRVSFTGKRFEALNVTMSEILTILNPRFQKKGGPAWIDTDRFDILAKADEGAVDPSPAAGQKMVLALLQERFKLSFHTENREVDGLALVAGKKSPRLNQPKDGEEPKYRVGDRGELVFQKMSTVGLANILTNLLQVAVVDQSEIAGNFDFTLEPRLFLDGSGGPDAYRDAVRAALVDLGLKFETAKATSYTLVIDRVERPSEN
jgi:hypothetical protein